MSLFKSTLILKPFSHRNSFFSQVNNLKKKSLPKIEAFLEMVKEWGKMRGGSGDEVFGVRILEGSRKQDVEMGATVVLETLEGLFGDWLHSLPC